MTKRILIWDSRPPAIRDRIHDVLAAANGFEIEVHESPQDLEAVIEGAEVVATAGLSSNAFNRARSLQWLHEWGAGVDRVLLPEIRDSTVAFTCGKGNGGVTMAEWAMLVMLMWSKNAGAYLKSHSRKEWSPLDQDELTGKTVGIIGLGNSGADLARKCKAFNMRVLGVRRTKEPCPHVDTLYPSESLPEMLALSDFVVVTAPLTSETRGMLGEKEFKAMKSNSYLIVTSRGGIAQDDALLHALNNGWIAGAGLDAHSLEPLPKDSPLWTAPGVLITPHTAAGGPGQGPRSAEIFIDNLRRYVQGKPLRNLVDKQVGY